MSILTHLRLGTMAMLYVFALPFVTFGLYAILNAVIFHFRVVRRPLFMLGVTFPPFLVAQSLVIAQTLQLPDLEHESATLPLISLAYGLPILIAVLLYFGYLQFYCLMEYSISLRMLDHFLESETHTLTFSELRCAYPLEEVVERKCKAAGAVGLLRTETAGAITVLSLHPRAGCVLRALASLKKFCNWSDG